VTDLIAAPTDWGETDPHIPRYWMHHAIDGWCLCDASGGILRKLTGAEATTARLVAQKHDVTPAIEEPLVVSPATPVSGQVEVIDGGGYVLNLQHLARVGG
jgi:hypothetical protein